MKFLNNIFKSDKRNAEKTPETKMEKKAEFDLGEFNINDFPENERNNAFYFYEYSQPDGEWVDIGQPICNIRIGEQAGPIFSEGIVSASKAGILEWTSKKDELLTNGKVFYKLHPKGKYHNENSIENSEFKVYFKGLNYIHSFDKWLIDDGSYVKVGEPIFQFKDSKFKEHIKHSPKEGFIHIIEPKKVVFIYANELAYIIRDTDEKRIEQRFVNKPNVIIDESTNSTIIKWHRVSSWSEISHGIKTKSDNFITDFLFSFNFIENNDYIVFHFDPKQIRPKKFDKVNFLFDNGEQIQFELVTKPVSSKNRMNEKILEYKSLITKTELELFATSNFKKWKISLVSDKREILGGEKSGNEFYPTKNNIQIVIRKFANDYIDLVKNTIPNYKPTELKQTEPIKETTIDFCFVYLMYDTANGYYKIGISNNPEYREKTLQSEKPTIEVIAYKKFPIRKIAESIEKALHETYSEKRLRGEWFELDQDDAGHIKQTLS